jgi:hypothetical protein
MPSTADSTSKLYQQNHRLNSKAMILFVLSIAACWVLLYEINHWLFAEVQISGFVSWVFLPAAIRMLSVMIGGWAGSLGLFLGAMTTNAMIIGLDLLSSLMLATLCALGPLAAVYLCIRWFKLPQDFAGLQRSQLFVFAIVGAFFNAIPHNIYFFLTGMSQSVWAGLVPMFIGDLFGTLVVLYLASLAIRFFVARAPG